MSDRISKEKRSWNMSLIKAKNTSIELQLRSALWRKGYRYRVNDKRVFGKPDIVFPKQKIAIFCDSEFWHGKEYLEGKAPKSNKAFWRKKLERNIQRDKEVNEMLQRSGWRVIRFWSKDIKKKLNECVNVIELELLKNEL